MNDAGGKGFYGLHITRTSLIIGIVLATLWWVGESLIHCFVFGDGAVLHCLLSMDANELWMRSLVAGMVCIGYCYVASERVYKKKAYAIITSQRARMLNGLLPICSYCKKIRGQDNRWHRIETFLTMRTGVDFTHGICPDCADKTQI
ncbi:MAG: hypothetical protein A3J24_09170 [Deltaproteobacteria bacterium RIFCSPLOWO2_02_FULL_53_8]|nr:MAG: hypothetical protein A3J24_09170 [Deltaproteobacteria bacterium RIFCSPLOWO2_02_FULL_53_8]